MEINLDAIALALSAIALVITYLQNKKINEINLMSVYFNDIFKEYLLDKIPIALSKIRISDTDEKIKDFDDFLMQLDELRKKALYFKYNDKTFYDNLKNNLLNMEDWMLECSASKFVGNEQKDFYNELQIKVQEIYRIISDKYINRK